MPLVSIGMPVYNEAAHIDSALSSIRKQSYPNLEIIVCDNASSDGTVEICRKHGEVDKRIRLVASTQNDGASANFRRAFELASGEYFMWASGHDLWSSELISDCVALLELHPDASLAHASCDWIGPSGERLSRESGWSDTRGMAPAGRFFTVLWGNMHPVLGVMRSSKLEACWPLPAIVGGDLVLLSRLSLRGDFLHVPGPRWSRRELRSEATYGEKIERYASTSFGITRSAIGRAFPLLALPWQLTASVARSPLGLADKAGIITALLPSLALRYLIGRRA